MVGCLSDSLVISLANFVLQGQWFPGHFHRILCLQVIRLGVLFSFVQFRMIWNVLSWVLFVISYLIAYLCRSSLWDCVVWFCILVRCSPDRCFCCHLGCQSFSCWVWVHFEGFCVYPVCLAHLPDYCLVHLVGAAGSIQRILFIFDTTIYCGRSMNRIGMESLCLFPRILWHFEILWIHWLTGVWGPPLLPPYCPQYVVDSIHIW